MSKYIIIILLFIASAYGSAGQSAAVYNINNTNGLSSNHVYRSLVDKSGYLWIATTNGLFRYNGYTLTKYDYEDGLPSNDIWGLHEDARGRIWLMSIAQQMGYIKNNTYTRVYKNTDSILTEIYPLKIIEIGDKIVFINVSTSNNKWLETGIISNDTLNGKLSYIDKVYSLGGYTPSNNTLFKVADSNLYVFDLKTWINTPSGGFPETKVSKHLEFNLGLLISRESQQMIYFVDKHLAYYRFLSTSVPFFNTQNYTFKTIPTPENEKGVRAKVTFCYTENNTFYIITNQGVLKIDSTLNVQQYFRYDALFQKDILNEYNNTYFSNDTMWGSLLSTNDTGLFIRFPNTNCFKKASIELSQLDL